jgi:hypothetical protein
MAKFVALLQGFSCQCVWVQKSVSLVIEVKFAIANHVRVMTAVFQKLLVTNFFEEKRFKRDAEASS